MGTQEYVLLVLVIVIPLIVAVVVTLWTLEQARLRSKKNRRSTRPTSAQGPSSDLPPTESP